MDMEMTVILRMNDSHTENVPGDSSVSAVGIVLQKVELFSVILLLVTWMYLIQHLSFYTVQSDRSC